uniref:Uncharacterized protein n=1 Tax=Strigamia maritima TaxID=126957 RepID=T1IWZ3_STRMM
MNTLRLQLVKKFLQMVEVYLIIMELVNFAKNG